MLVKLAQGAMLDHLELLELLVQLGLKVTKEIQELLGHRVLWGHREQLVLLELLELLELLDGKAQQELELLLRGLLLIKPHYPLLEMLLGMPI